MKPGQLFKATYPDYFPCPTWEFSKGITEFAARTRFDSGWTRQRKRWPEGGVTVQLAFTMKTDMFDNWCRWVEANGHDWFAIHLERIGGVKQPVELRFITGLSYSYGTFDSVDVRVMADMAGNPARGDGGGIPSGDLGTPVDPNDPGYPGIVQPPDPYQYPECEPYACDAVRNHHLEVYENVWYAETATGNELDQAKGDMQLFGDFGPPLYFDPDPVYPDGCYTSIRRVGIGGGNAIRGLYREWAIGESTVNTGQMSMAISARDINAGGATGTAGFLRNNLRLVRVSDGVKLDSMFAGVESRNGPSLNLYIGGYNNPDIGSNYTEVFVPWSSLDDSYSDANIYHLDCTWQLTGSPGAYFFTMTATLFVNGIQVATATRPSESLSYGGVTMRVDREHIRFFDGNNTIGRINNVGVNPDSLVAPDVDAVARARNFADYETPSWCPGPRP